MHNAIETEPTRQPAPLPGAMRYDRPETTRTLATRLQDGSSQAFEELVDAYGSQLYSIAWRILQNSSDAEDCVQAALLKVFQSISRFRGDAALSTWLYRIVTNEALSQLRKKRRNPSVPIEPYLPQFENGHHAAKVWDWTQLPDLALQNQEFLDVFQSFVLELPPDYRVPYLLKDVEQLSESEVAKITGLPVSTLRTRVHRARLAIRERISAFLAQKSASGATAHAGEAKE